MSRNWTKEHRDELISAHGLKCVSCGEDDSNLIVWHHIVPLANGGEDSISNIIPVCLSCHKKIHGMKELSKQESKPGGRPRSNLTYEQYVRYVIGESTKEEILEECGASWKSDVKQLGETRGFDRRLFREYGIHSFRVASNGYRTLHLLGGVEVRINNDNPRKELEWIAQRMNVKGE